MKQAFCLFAAILSIASTKAIAEDHQSCAKNVSFAWAESGRVTPTVPAWVDKWVKKNGAKKTTLCFSQTPIANSRNYLLVLSNSRSAFYGVQPVARTAVNTSTTPVSGNGTITNTETGSTWLYNYSGTQTTTTTTTYTEAVPYSQTTTTLYLNAYDQNGYLVAARSRSITTQQGGNGANSLGYNLGAMLGAIHMKTGLLTEVLKAVSADCEGQSAARCTLPPSPSVSATTSAPTPIATMQAPMALISLPAASEAASAPATTAHSACDSAIESNISGDFNGWDDETIYKLDDGSIWQQANYHYHYHYAYHPEVVIYKNKAGACHIRVTDDDDEGVDVVRLK